MKQNVLAKIKRGTKKAAAVLLAVLLATNVLCMAVPEGGFSMRASAASIIAHGNLAIIDHEHYETSEAGLLDRLVWALDRDGELVIRKPLPEDGWSIDTCDEPFYNVWINKEPTIPWEVFKDGVKSIVIDAEQPDIDYDKYELSFPGYKALKSVSVSSSYITLGTLSGCDSLETTLLPDSMTEIPDGFFNGCTSLHTVRFPAGVRSIGYGSFKDCTALGTKNGQSVVFEIPEGVTKIDSQAFRGCTALHGVRIPGTLNYMGYDVFRSCSGLELHITDMASWCQIDRESGVSYYEPDYKLYVDGRLASEINIPYGVTSIAPYAFSEVKGLKKVYIPKTVIDIGSLAFYKCPDLESVIIAENANRSLEIRDGAFADCKSLGSVNIPDGTVMIGNEAFCNCFSLTSVSIPGSVREIGRLAFGSYSAYEGEGSKLSSVTIGEGVKRIGAYAFEDNPALESIVVPDGVEYIGECAFGGCENLSSIKLPDSLLYIGEGIVTGTNFYNTWRDDPNRRSRILYVDKYILDVHNTNNDEDNGVYTGEIIKPGTLGIADLSLCELYNPPGLPDGLRFIGRHAMYYDIESLPCLPAYGIYRLICSLTTTP